MAVDPIGFFQELRRRKVFRVAAVYAVVGWALVEISDTTFPRLALPDWAPTLVLVLVLLGFPVALVLAWALELTPDGIERQAVLDEGGDPAADGVAAASAAVPAGNTGASRRNEGVETVAAGPEAGGADRRSVAVLPFTNMNVDPSAAPEDCYLCEGLAEEIISVLTGLPGLRVIARTSSFAVARMDLDVREVGQRLNVGAILEGSVRRTGNRVRVTVQLVDTGDGAQIWSERYDRELTDVLELEDEVAAAVAARLRGKRVQKPRTERPPVDPLGYQAYLEGRHHFARATPEALQRAAECFEQAVAADPTFAPGFDALAELHWFLGFYGGVAPREAFGQSTWYALRALELDESLAETHALLGMLRKELDYNWPEVHRELALARALSPASPAVRLRYAISGPLPQGDLEETIAELELALLSDPLSLQMRWFLSGILGFAGRTDEAMAEARHMIDLYANHFLSHLALGMALDLNEDHAGAVRAFERANQLSGGIPMALGFLARAYGLSGQRDRARRILDDLAAAAGQRYVPPTALAFGYTGLDDPDAVFHWLDEAIAHRDPVVMPIKSWPFLAPLRTDPRYRALLSEMNLAGPDPSQQESGVNPDGGQELEPIGLHE